MKRLILTLLTLLMTINLASAETLEQVKKQDVTNKLQTTQGKQIKTSVDKYSQQYKVDKHLIHAVIMTESNYNPNARSSCGATGLMQLMPTTFKARQVGTNIYNVDQNIHAGTKHLAGLIAKYDGNVYKALAAYNTGGGNIKKDKPIPQYAKKYVDKVYYHKKIIETIQM